MSSEMLTADQAKFENIRVMGEELGSVYDALWQQMAWLHRKWSEYVVLFGTKKSRVDLLNETAPVFTRIVQDALWEDVLLHIARLTDPPKSAGKHNLTIQYLAQIVTHADTKVTVEILTKETLLATEFCRDWRNRHIAHRDLHLALKREAEPLKSASREKVNDALKALAAVMNAVAMHYRSSTTFFDFDVAAGGAMSLLYALDDGLNVERSRNERQRNGHFDPNEYRPYDL
ncbi:MAG: hypothetical protein V4448_01080 [Pseudomonadota bacterium]